MSPTSGCLKSFLLRHIGVIIQYVQSLRDKQTIRAIEEEEM